MSLDNLSVDEKAKIKQTVEAGVQALKEIETLRGDLKEYVSGLATELDVKPALITKAIKLAHKNEQENAVERVQQEMTDVEIILNAAGRI